MKVWQTRIGLILVLFLVILPGSLARAEGDWMDGQSAIYVLGQSHFESDNDSATASGLKDPRDVVVDERHQKLYVVDGGNNRVLRYSLPIAFNKPSAELVIGQSSMTNSEPDTTQNGLRDPRGVAVDSTGRLWIADTGNHRVLWFHDAYALTENGPMADGVLGQPDFSTRTTGLGPAAMNSPMEIASGDISTIYVADRGNNRILRFVDAASKENGDDANGVLGQSGFFTNATSTASDGMDSPRGLALDGDVLYVADTNNYRVLRFDDVASKSNGADANGVLGQPDFTTNERAITATGMDGPARVAIDSVGGLYVSDALVADRVLVFLDAAGKPNGAAADHVLGQRDFESSDEESPTQIGLNMDGFGGGISLSAQFNYLVVSDNENNRVMIFKPWLVHLPMIIGR